jgi:hypothetical protein
METVKGSAAKCLGVLLRMNHHLHLERKTKKQPHPEVRTRKHRMYPLSELTLIREVLKKNRASDLSRLLVA